MFNNRDQNEQRGHEDGPEYRSVMIQPLTAPTMPMRSFSPSPKLSKPTPTTTSINSNSNKTQDGAGSSSFPCRWIVQALSELPTDFLLVRTNVYVKDTASPQLIANRICNTLKTLSITIDSKTFEGENVLLAETQNGAKFAIRLFSHNSMIVVEVQRQSGCSFEFRDAAKNILRSAKGLQTQQRSVPARRFSIPPTLPKRSREVHQKCIRDDFQIAYSMLHSKKSDAQVLALESMEKMTKTCKAKDVAAKSVLGNYDCLKQLLLLLDTYNTTDQSISEMEPSHSSILRRKILTVLANSCEAISKADLADILSTNDSDLKTRSFLSLLLSSLEEASIRPHDAFQAVRCLRYLLISKEVESVMIEMSAMEVISSACNAGFNCHEALEQESNKLMAQLKQNVC